MLSVMMKVKSPVNGNKCIYKNLKGHVKANNYRGRVGCNTDMYVDL